MGGGLFSIFHRKSASKAQKACDFAYFTSQWGGARALPPPPWLRYWLGGVLRKLVLQLKCIIEGDLGVELLAVWRFLCFFWQKIAILAPFEIHFERF